MNFTFFSVSVIWTEVRAKKSTIRSKNTQIVYLYFNVVAGWKKNIVTIFVENVNEMMIAKHK